MEILLLAFDIILIFAGLWMVLTVARAGIGGVVGRTLRYITIGALLLGLANILETVAFRVLAFDMEIVEVIHRIVILIGFIFLIMGIQRLAQLQKD